MAGYNVTDLIKPKANEAHIEYFFTKKGKDLFCIVPIFNSQVRIKNLNIPPGTTATVLSTNKKLLCKQSGKDCVIDLSPLRPGEIPAEIFVIKLQNVL